MVLAEDHTAEMRGRSLILEVRPSNGPALAFYAALDYTQRRIHSKYYPNGEDAIIMTKRVASSDF